MHAASMHGTPSLTFNFLSQRSLEGCVLYKSLARTAAFFRERHLVHIFCEKEGVL